MKHKRNSVHVVDDVMAIIIPLQILLLLPSHTVESAANISLPGCQDSCGGISIPYPFGIGDNCSGSFKEVVCNTTNNGTSTPYLNMGDYEILSISLSLGQIRLKLPAVTPHCYNTTKELKINGPGGEFDFMYSPFWVNKEKNKFIVIGCSTFAYLHHYSGDYAVGCLSTCDSVDSLNKDGASCSGIGCCQTALPKELDTFSFEFADIYNNSEGYNVSRCGYAMLVEDGGFVFKPTYITTNKLIDQNMPVVFDWSMEAVGLTAEDLYESKTCEDAQTNKSTYACKSHYSECSNSISGRGYICNCSKGFEGNPYLDGGCQDIDECVNQNPCPKPGKCHNLLGGYRCSCSFGRHMNNDNICELNLSLVIGITIAVAFSTSIIMLLLYFSIAKHMRLFEKRKREKLKQQFFIQNRGLLLQQLIISHENTTEKMRIFRLDELEKATNSFDNALILGRGGHGEVYKGILSDQRVVAIKRSKIVDQGEIDQFINEVAILSQVNHRNVVKIFGCCLETEVPLVVYEFISNGTLYNHLHVEEYCSLTWKQRLRIALEAAGAISYLHSSASISVFHRDIKSSNILLDDYFTAKVSDFGASRSVQIDQTGITTAIQGTYGYLDPEYYHTGRLTHKSDVYSFGVILAELLTRRKPLFSSRMFEGGSLVAYFGSAMKENRLFDILDPQVVNEGNKTELQAVAKLVEMCLRIKGEERPTMKEVEVRLEVLWRSNEQHKHPWTSQSLEERELILLNYPRGIDTTQQYSFEQDLDSSSYFPR